MIAANEHGIPVDWVKQEQIHKQTGIPLKTYHTGLAAKLGLAVPPYWSNRAIAFGAGLTMAACRP